MHNIQRILFIALVSCVFSIRQASGQDSSRIMISLLTCTPGSDLYSIFGHSALRVIDSNSVSDIVYNYGTFNFEEPGFYMKFIRGKLRYSLSLESFEDFKFSYQAENRGITEQILNLSGDEKMALRYALNENAKEENRYYQYDFFMDNCTTRLRDLIVNHKTPAPVLPAVMPENFRFRQAIHQYLDAGKQYWSKLGIDILLGARTDAVMTVSQQQFLPDNLMHALDSSRNTPMVAASANLFRVSPQFPQKDWFTPALFFISLLVIFILLGLIKHPAVKAILTGLDGFLFFTTGALGILLILMWVATDHSMTKDNYNLCWALPPHIVIAFFINSKKKWVKKYLMLTIILNILLLIVWPFLPQQMNNALLPFVALLLFRAGAHYIKIKEHEKAISQL
ncbi:MAG: hypothetical protein JWQ27_876 [Ferruginibacter sp.]|nr:hypothetical protein [Ferruginibacter sp.]